MDLQHIPDKSIAKLIDAVSRGLGCLYKPKAIRNEAEAQADAIRILAKARADEILIIDEANDMIASRAKKRVVHQEIKRQINLENIVNKTEDYLNVDVSDEPVNDDWLTAFFNHSQDISDEQMQDLWARILAGEIANPGSYSLRSMQQIKFMSQAEARIFAKVCTIAFEEAIVTISELNSYISIDELIKLDSIGLINYTPLNTLRLSFSIKKGSSQILKNSGLSIGIKPLDINSETVTFQGFPLTTTGKELRKLINNSPNINYLKCLAEEYKKTYIIGQAVLISNNANGMLYDIRPFN